MNRDCTYTLCGGDVHVAADERQTIIHAHLEINHPETEEQTQKGRVSLSMLGRIITVQTKHVCKSLFSLEHFLLRLSLFDRNDVT